jgi:hypothetical protein
MEQGPPSEADSHSSSPEILHLLWSQKFNLQCSPELATGPYPAHTFPPYFTKVHSKHIPIYACLGLRSGLFPSGFPTKILYAFHILPMRSPPEHIHTVIYRVIISDVKRMLLYA